MRRSLCQVYITYLTFISLPLPQAHNLSLQLTHAIHTNHGGIPRITSNRIQIHLTSPERSDPKESDFFRCDQLQHQALNIQTQLLHKIRKPRSADSQSNLNLTTPINNIWCLENFTIPSLTTNCNLFLHRQSLDPIPPKRPRERKHFTQSTSPLGIFSSIHPQLSVNTNTYRIQQFSRISTTFIFRISWQINPTQKYGWDNAFLHPEEKSGKTGPGPIRSGVVSCAAINVKAGRLPRLRRRTQNHRTVKIRIRTIFLRTTDDRDPLAE